MKCSTSSIMYCHDCSSYATRKEVGPLQHYSYVQCHTHALSLSLSFSLTHACTEQEQSLLSINEKYADTNNDGRKSPLGELKAVLVRQNYYLSL